MIILALDIATSTGCAVGKAGGAPVAWSVNIGKGLTDDQRFSNILRLTSQLLEQHKPDMVAIEAPVGGRDTSHLLVGLAACVRGCVANRGVPLVSYHSGSIRKHFVGRTLTTRDFPTLSKAAGKMAIKAEVMKRCKLLGWDVPDHDSADAAALFDFAGAKAGIQVLPGGGLFNGRK
jgi:Holliday junction resolvasome RuvABC endonuclease subunit